MIDDIAAVRLAEEAKRRAEAATPGPWKSDIGYVIAEIHSDDEFDSRNGTCATIADCRGSTRLRVDEAEHNRDFIAAARQDVPALADAVLRLAAENQRLREGLTEADSFLVRAKAGSEVSWAAIQLHLDRAAARLLAEDRR